MLEFLDIPLKIGNILGFIAMLGFVFLIPTINTWHFKRKHTLKVFILNITLGWCLLFWLFIFMWSINE